MMEAAKEGLTRPDGTRPLLIAVTQLTSTSKKMLNQELLIPGEVDRAVAHYAKVTQAAGLDGVVCSARETALVKATCGVGFLTVTPGIRFAEGDVQDQDRKQDRAEGFLAGLVPQQPLRGKRAEAAAEEGEVQHGLVEPLRARVH